jgi:hypothetical protein
MTSDSCSIIKEFLEEIKAGNIHWRRRGLCSNLGDFCISRRLFYHEIYEAKEILRSMMCNFPKYTGDPVYPLVPQHEYDAHQIARVDFYDPATSYGAIRLEFVEWALEEIAQNRVSYMKS